jgi:hypothetical protein
VLNIYVVKREEESNIEKELRGYLLTTRGFMTVSFCDERKTHQKYGTLRLPDDIRRTDSRACQNARTQTSSILTSLRSVRYGCTMWM